MLLIEVLCFPRLCLQVGVDFRLVGMVVGKGCVKLSQRQVAANAETASLPVRLS